MSIGKLSANICLALLSMAVALAVGELVLRVLAPTPEPTDIRGMVTPDEEFGHRLVPSSSHVVDGVMGDFSTNVRINAHGFRSPDYAVHPGARTFRIALFGDSEVFGIGVEEQDMLNAAMEELLRQDRGVDYEVLNFAMPAIGTIVQGRIFERVAVDWEPDAAVFVVTIANDLLDDVSFTEFTKSRDAPKTTEDRPARRRIGWKKLRLYSFARFRILPHLPRFLTPPASWVGDIPPSVAAWYANDDLEDDFALMTDALSRAKAVCDRDGVEMYLAAVPARAQFDPTTMRLLRNTTRPELLELIESDWDRPQRMLRSFAEEKGISYVGVLDEFTRLAGEGNLRLKHPHDGHLNARGTLELARLLVGAIRAGHRGDPPSGGGGGWEL